MAHNDPDSGLFINRFDDLRCISRVFCITWSVRAYPKLDTECREFSKFVNCDEDFQNVGFGFSTQDCELVGMPEKGDVGSF